MSSPSPSSLGRIDRVVMENFKSYGGRHQLGPFATFTAIIGVNGSGKSNVLDAVSFVLGVRSQSLRGTALVDLIHKREEDEPEVKEAPRDAFVELIYIDAHKRELHFKRTITRRGESHYLYQGRVVSHKQYEEELGNIGILVRAKNFLVFQGDVQDIAAKDPRQFTEYFETISGSITLKKEFEELKREAEAAEEEFIRTFEKKRNIVKEKKQIKEQVDEAARYSELVGRTRDLKLQYLLWQLFNVETDVKTKTTEKAERETELAEAKVSKDESTNALNALIANAAKVRREVAENEKAMKTQSDKVEKRRPEVVNINTQIDHTEKAVSKEEKSLKESGAQWSKHEKELAALGTEQKDTAAKLSEIKSIMASDTAKGKELKMAEEQLSEYNRLKVTAAEATAELRNKLGDLKDEQNRVSQDLNKVTTSVTTLNERYKNSVETLEEHRDRVKRLQVDVDSNKKLLSTQSSSLSQMKAKNDSDEKRKAQLTSELEVIISKMAEARAERLESQHESKMSDTVALLKNHFSGVKGRMTELCRPTQKKFNLAISVAMGKSMEAVVVDSSKTAYECIEYLRSQRLGQFTFIPLDSIRTKPIQQSLRNIGGDFILAIDALTFDEEVQRALLYALGNTLICDSLEQAREFAYGSLGHQFDRKPKIVTLDGSVIHKGGNLEGGTSRFQTRAQNKWDEHELQRLKEKKDKVVGELSAVDQVERKRDEESRLRTEVQTLTTTVEAKEAEIAVFTSKLTSVEKLIGGIRAEIDKLKPQEKALSEQLEKKGKEVSSLEKQISKEEDQIYAAFSKKVGVSNIRQYEENRLTTARKNLEERTNLEITLSKLDEQMSYEQNRGNDIQTRRDEQQKNITELKGKLKTLREQKDRVDKEMATETAKVNEFLETLRGFSKQLDTIAEQQKAAKRSVKEANDIVESVEKHIGLLTGQLESIGIVKDNIHREVQLEQIELPLVAEGQKRRGPVAAKERPTRRRRAQNDDEDGDEEMDDENDNEDEDEESPFDSMFGEVSDGSLVDFHVLNLLSITDREKCRQSYIKSLGDIQSEIDKLAPNLKAVERYDDVNKKVESAKDEWEEKKQRSKDAADKFEAIKSKRVELFMRCYNHVAKAIESVYKQLTRSPDFPTGGKAYLSLENSDDPFNGGIKYTAMPPMKRFRPMESLSGGEKTVAALALLFAIHSYHPAPFFVLDEIDAALDNLNVTRVSNFIRQKAHQDGLQCIVISLKDTFYTKADALIGIYKDADKQASGVLSVDLTKYD